LQATPSSWRRIEHPHGVACNGREKDNEGEIDPL